MKRDIPIYKLVIGDDEESGVDYVAFVDQPAIERAWLAFNDETNKYSFKIEDEERRIVTGPLMIANLPIYRYSEEVGEFYAIFDKGTIDKIVHKFFKSGFANNVNEMHDPTKVVDGVYMFESFIVDRSRGINPPAGFKGVSDGSWFGSYKIEDEVIWDKVKSGDFQGFSVEGIFTPELEAEREQDIIDKIVQVIDGIE